MAAAGPPFHALRHPAMDDRFEVGVFELEVAYCGDQHAAGRRFARCWVAQSCIVADGYRCCRRSGARCCAGFRILRRAELSGGIDGRHG